jgi:hypothetical protein
MKGVKVRDSLSWLYVAAIALVVAASVGACGRDSPEERIREYNKQLGPQGEYTGTHLIIRWPPTRRKGDQGVTLKIPREYLEEDRPVHKDESGGIQFVNIRFALPDGAPWERRPAPPPDSPDTKEWQEHFQSRVFVAINRDSGGASLMSIDDTRREVSPWKSEPQYLRDKDIGGLEAYTRMLCLDLSQPITADAMKLLDAKSDTDPSPPHCWLAIGEMLLVGPVSATRDDEVVRMRCMSGSCNVYFAAGGRGGLLNIKHENLDRWRDYVEPARRLINSFVVSQ